MEASLRPHLSVFDTVSLMIGIVIGAGIYETAPMIFNQLAGPWTVMGVWVLGGLLSLAGAFCYAELATAYPRSGGDYIYLSRAYGPWVGFLFGWAQLAVILTGSIGMMAFIFADYGTGLLGLDQSAGLYLAVATVVALSLINIFGVHLGRRTQNFLTTTKMLGLGLIVLAGLITWLTSDGITFPPMRDELTNFSWSSFGVAMILVLYTYGGWNDAAFVAAELKDQRRNISLALITGTLAIVVIYFLINWSYLVRLGYDGAKNSTAIAIDIFHWPIGANLMAVLVMISALGAVNGLIFTGARLYSALGKDHAIFAWLSRWHRQLKTPALSLVAQAVMTILLIAIVGTHAGRSWVEQIFGWFDLSTPDWSGHGGFGPLLAATAPVFWLFFLLTGLSLFVLRFKEPKVARPYRVPLYPITPIIFCLASGYMLYGSVMYAGHLTWVGMAFLGAGFPLYFMSINQGRRKK